MSFTKKYRNIRSKNGKVFPMNTTKTGVNISDQDVIKSISTALFSAVGWLPSAIKIVSHKTGRNPRTVKNWFNQDCAPTAAALIELMREFDEVHEAVLQLADRKPSGTIDPDLQRRAELALKVLTGDTHENIHH